MRGVSRLEVLHRVRGQSALLRSARSLQLRVHRYSRSRARTPAEIKWTARALDALDLVVRAMEEQPGAPATTAAQTWGAPPSATWSDTRKAEASASSARSFVHPENARTADEGNR
jgi:hypothetical protein